MIPLPVQELETLWDEYEELAYLERWNRQHPRRHDVLDNIDDCGTPDAQR